jgi:hypothetical protein
MYNFKLYDAFCDAARELDIAVTCPNDGSCIYLDLPNNLNQTFWAMLWTPLNKLKMVRDDKDWQHKLDTLRNNHADFHLEFCTKETEHGNYSFFPEINNKAQSQVTKQDIKTCIERILDQEHFDQHVLVARLKEPSDD